MSLVKSIYWRIYIIRLALRWIPRFNLGDRVRYMGREWVLNQGVKAPIWTLFDVKSKRTHEVHESKFRKCWSLRSVWYSFRSGYRFYMVNWYRIWMRNGIELWMTKLKIWAGEPPTVVEDKQVQDDG